MSLWSCWIISCRRGPLFRSVDYKGNEDIDYSDASCVELPMAVLVNGDSYSAAEFFAAALQELRRGNCRRHTDGW